MSVKKSIMFAILLISVLAVVIWQVLCVHEPEPVYEGKPLTFWMKSTFVPEKRTEISATKIHRVILELNTNAIPTVLRLLRANDPPWKLNLIALMQKQHFIKIEHTPAADLNYQVATWFEQLGADA